MNEANLIANLYVTHKNALIRTTNARVERMSMTGTVIKDGAKKAPTAWVSPNQVRNGIRGRQLAEDILHDAVVEFLQAANNPEVEIREDIRFLQCITLRTLIDTVRREIPRLGTLLLPDPQEEDPSKHPLCTVPSHTNDPEQWMDNGQTFAVVERVLRSLPQRNLEVFLAVVVDGKSYKAESERTGRSEGALRVMVNGVRDQLRREVCPEHELAAA